MKSTAPETARPLSSKKRILFWTILAAAPILFLVCLELALRLFSYRGDLNLVVEKTFGGRRMFTINRSVAGRYFVNSSIETPEPEEDPFEIAKPANTKRIFCLGESTMQGFPYVFNATAPSFLRDRLQAELPRQRIEVVNVGLSAVGSFIVRDFIGELVPYQPDLFIVYLGHNEFYGIYQAGSAAAMRGGPALTRLSISLSRFKTYLLFRDAYAWISGLFSPSRGRNRGTLMEQVVGNSSIPYEGPTYREALATYMENLDAMISVAQEHHIPILFSTVVSNIHDQPPFIGAFSPETDSAARKEWREDIAEGDTAMSRGDFGGALTVYEKAFAADSSNATGRFKCGQALAANGSFDRAKEEFERARDLDALRFRATGEFNSALAATCSKRDVPVSHIDSAFAAASPHGLVGNELILEHLHPNIDGYFLMAKVWANDIRTSSLLGDNLDWAPAPDDSALIVASDVSPFDREMGRIRTTMLTSHWPFQPRVIPRPPDTDDSVSSITRAYLDRQIAWPMARFRLGDLYAGRGQLAQARREYLAVTHVMQYSYLPWIRVADLYYLQRDLGKAEEYYRRSIGAEDNPYSHMKLGTVFLAEERAEDAVQQIDSAFALEGRQGEKFTLEGAANGRFLLGVAYAKLGRIPDARVQLQRAIAIQPDFQKARGLLEQLR